MSIIRRMFEVRVKVGEKLKSYHYSASNSKQAAQRAKKHGRVVSAKKVDIQALLGKIENLNLSEEPIRQYLGSGIYEDELNLDEVLGLTKKKKDRSKRLEDKSRDKQEST